MPKTKISEEYMKNVKIYRGPTHDIPNLPQFAPDRSIYKTLPNYNVYEDMKKNPEEVKIAYESSEGLAESKT